MREDVKANYIAPNNDSYDELYVKWEDVEFSHRAATVPVLIVYSERGTWVQYDLLMHLHFNLTEVETTVEVRMIYSKSCVVIGNDEHLFNAILPITCVPNMTTVRNLEKMAKNEILRTMEKKYLIPAVEAGVKKNMEHWSKREQEEQLTLQSINQAAQTTLLEANKLIHWLENNVIEGAENE